MKFELYKDVEGFWRWRLKAANGETISLGDGYRTKEDAERAVSLVTDTNRTTNFVRDINRFNKHLKG